MENLFLFSATIWQNRWICTWEKRLPCTNYVLLMPYKIKSIHQETNFLEDKSFAIYLTKKSKHQQEHWHQSNGNIQSIIYLFRIFFLMFILIQLINTFFNSFFLFVFHVSAKFPASKGNQRKGTDSISTGLHHMHCWRENGRHSLNINKSLITGFKEKKAHISFLIWLQIDGIIPKQFS